MTNKKIHNHLLSGLYYCELKSILFIFIMAVSTLVSGQLKPVQITRSSPNGPKSVTAQSLQKLRPLHPGVPPAVRKLPLGFQISSSFFQPFQYPHLKVKNWDQTHLPVWVEGRMERSVTRNDMPGYIYHQMENLLEASIHMEAVDKVFEITEDITDELEIRHITFRQNILGIPVYGADYKAHIYPGRDRFVLNGRPAVHPGVEELPLHITHEDDIIRSVVDDLHEEGILVSPLPYYIQVMMKRPAFTATKVWYKSTPISPLRLTMHVSAIPNAGENWDYFIDLLTGEIIDKISNICQLYHHDHGSKSKNASIQLDWSGQKFIYENNTFFNDGPFSAQGIDLSGVNQSFNTYRLSNLFYMIDATQDMYINGSLPNDPKGIILTADGKKNTPYNDNFNPSEVTSPNNVWNRRNSVSAHVNATKAYEYFKDIHDRNSIDGSGGNIISFINISEEDGSGMDNAFWNGFSIFYGNGNVAFTDLAGGLDVAGHEMSHGVVQHSAGLIYKDESGALNESFSDIFGAMIERKNWQIGERVVNPQVFTSGAMRDMSDPHNGGNSLDDNGYQPKHMSEKFTGSENNGGVHINSGIVNYAYYLFATQIGIEKAEQIYYRALINYLGKSSQFIDCRNSVIQSAIDLYGNGPEMQAAINAFDQVGIQSGTGENYEEELEPNPGTAFLLLSDADLSALYLADENLNLLANPLFDIPIISKPSVTDDGQFVVFIGQDKKLYLIVFDFEQSGAEIEVLQSDPVWRNVAVSKDGTLLAALTDELTDEVLIYSFAQEEWREFRLFNQTTGPNAPPLFNVLYADAIEWSHDGSVLMYDALNHISVDQQSWDISFLFAWDNQTNDFDDGSIVKMFQNIPQGIDIGNPTFSKNSPHIIAFDFLDNNEFYILGLNLERNDIGLIAENSTIGYPSFDIEDASIVYDAENTAGSPLLARMALASDKINGIGTATALFQQGKWGVWFANGDRVLTSIDEPVGLKPSLFDIFPNPGKDVLHIRLQNPSAHEAYVIEIYNVMGQRVYQYQMQQGEREIQLTSEVSSLPKGSYFIRVWGDGCLVSKVFVKQ